MDIVKTAYAKHLRPIVASRQYPGHFKGFLNALHINISISIYLSIHIYWATVTHSIIFYLKVMVWELWHSHGVFLRTGDGSQALSCQRIRTWWVSQRKLKVQEKRKKKKVRSRGKNDQSPRDSGGTCKLSSQTYGCDGILVSVIALATLWTAGWV